LNRLCSAPISTFIWQITDRFPNRTTVPLFEALEAYVGPIAGDRTFSRRMDAVTHTVWLLHSLARLAKCQTLDNAVLLFSDRGVNGLADACPAIVELARLYNSLNNNDKRILVIATLLHDIGKAVDQETEGTHTKLGVMLAQKAGEAPEVLHAMEAHHGDVEARTVEAVIVQACDAISAARPGARRDTLEAYVKRLEKLETVAKSFPGVEKCYAIQAGREIRVMVEPNRIDDNAAVKLAHDIAKKIETELEYPGEVRVTVIREIRATDTAK
jgi:putative nucleotidyltransferase with HDIG domain